MLNKRRPIPNVVQFVTYEPRQLLEVVLNLVLAQSHTTIHAMSANGAGDGGPSF